MGKEGTMKKRLFCVLSMLVLFSVTTVCYAGSIPESLLHEASSQVYFGEIKSVDGESITIIQRQKIKGEFSEDREVTYAGFSSTDLTFTDSPKIGEIYLCGFINENNPLYIWEVTDFETEDPKIKNADDQSKRLMEYLNTGKFEEQEKERNTAISASSGAGLSSEGPASEITGSSAERTDDITAQGNVFSFVLIIAGIILIGIVFLYYRKRKK